MSLHLFGWYGGKARPRVSRFLLDHMPPAERFVDLYGGSAAVLLAREPSKLDVFNDLNGDLVRLFRIVRDAPEALERVVSLTPHSREEYEAAAERADLPDIEWARRFLVFVGQGHSGVLGSGWSKSKVAAALGPASRHAEVGGFGWRIAPVAERLMGVQIDKRPALDAIALYDHEDVLFYADPPYVRSARVAKQAYGGYEVSPKEHANLFMALSRAKGAAAVSGYRSPEYEVILRHMPPVWVRYDCEGVLTSAAHHSRVARATRTESLWVKQRGAG